MMNFFQQYINSCSSFHIKLSVHMKAQFSKKTRIMKKLEKILNSVSIKVNSVRFKESFKNVNISESDHEIILFIMHNFLHSDMKLFTEQVNTVLDNQLLH